MRKSAPSSGIAALETALVLTVLLPALYAGFIIADALYTESQLRGAIENFAEGITVRPAKVTAGLQDIWLYGESAELRGSLRAKLPQFKRQLQAILGSSRKLESVEIGYLRVQFNMQSGSIRPDITEDSIADDQGHRPGDLWYLRDAADRLLESEAIVHSETGWIEDLHCSQFRLCGAFSALVANPTAQNGLIAPIALPSGNFGRRVAAFYGTSHVFGGNQDGHAEFVQSQFLRTSFVIGLAVSAPLSRPGLPLGLSKLSFDSIRTVQPRHDL
ncbi:MAG: hypothetical protein K1X83_03255 [Oligoflexia bacterium]|nr:hypothetical protein [Oligoflexia bacterium]